MNRKAVVALAAAALTGAAVTGWAAFVPDPVSLTAEGAKGECAVSWRKPGVVFAPLTPGAGPGSFATTDGTGRVEIAGEGDLPSLVADSAALTRAITITGEAKGGFSLRDGAGNVIEASDPEIPRSAENLLQGVLTFVVKTPADPAGTRTPAFTYVPSGPLSPQLELMPTPRVTIPLTIALTVTPQFAAALNTAFGEGSVKSGDAFGTCRSVISAE
ncbi:hypothetical protein [Streptomyces sp. UNOB3_S3]|uniref:hypothetical protein n=1 Tax=Streptomyces sp. UNOB3_S3 TaxID=2871682 RepID=UPI001E37BC77|nr:hypothetical protein [Streptomyces sp. UNOB3_S3]MCC3778526.1 hypothetical protein [Streptomyces sp. UNOB3_S3]